MPNEMQIIAPAPEQVTGTPENPSGLAAPHAPAIQRRGRGMLLGPASLSPLTPRYDKCMLSFP